MGLEILKLSLLFFSFCFNKKNQYGVKVSARFGLGILRSNEVAKITNIKTTL